MLSESAGGPSSRRERWCRGRDGGMYVRAAAACGRVGVCMCVRVSCVYRRGGEGETRAKFKI